MVRAQPGPARDDAAGHGPGDGRVPPRGGDVGEAGFDLLEIHFAHGYLLASFISPLTNLRGGRVRGDVDGRLRFPLEVLAAVRAAWPPEKPISVRISAVDWAEDGMTADGAVEVAHRLEGGGRGHHRRLGRADRPLAGACLRPPVPDALLGPASGTRRGSRPWPWANISSFMDVNTILAAGRADLCCLARAHLWDPYWTRHAAYRFRGADPLASAVFVA